MSSYFTGSWMDVYDHSRCSVIVALKAFLHLKIVTVGKLVDYAERPRKLSVTKAIVKSIFEGLSSSDTVSHVLTDTQTLQKSPVPFECAEKTRVALQKLVQERGEIKVLGELDGKHPYLSEYVMPHMIAYSERSRNPFIIEIKSSPKPDAFDIFQAKFYNTIASTGGLYVLKKHRENGSVEFSPKLVKGDIETVIICSPSESCFTVNDRLDLNIQRIRDVWQAKQLGFRGLTPDSDCDNDCPHRRVQKKYGIRLKEGHLESLPPLPLVFARGIVDLGYDLDLNFQVAYADHLFWSEFYEKHVDSNTCKDFLIRNVGLDPEAVHLALDEQTGGKYSCQPNSKELLRACRDQLRPWRKIIGKRVAASAPEILKLALVIHSLHEGSKELIEDAWNMWQ